MLGSYIRSLIFSAAIVGLALLLTPKGRVRKAVGLVSAATMLLTVLLPLGSFDFPSYSEFLGEYRAEAERFCGEGKENSQDLNRLYIQQKCEAYILDKAAATGVQPVEAKVLAEWSDKGFFYPVSAEITGNFDEASKNRIASYIESELGIPGDQQKWRTDEKAQ